MAVTRDCERPAIAVSLRAAAGERLVYRVSEAPGDAQYVLTDDTGAVLLDSGASPVPSEVTWPTEPDGLGTEGSLQHVLAMQFISEGTLTYHVEKQTPSGDTEPVKECQFTNDGSADEFFESLRIFLRP